MYLPTYLLTNLPVVSYSRHVRNTQLENKNKGEKDTVSYLIIFHLTFELFAYLKNRFHHPITLCYLLEGVFPYRFQSHSCKRPALPATLVPPELTSERL